MSENKTFKPIGGIIAAELFPIAGLREPQAIVEGEGVKVTLADYASHYEESFASENCPVSVQHTLTLVADRAEAASWIDAEFLRHCAAEGVVARVHLATGERLTVGWSPRLGFEQALRLRSLKCATGLRPKHRPRVELVLECRDLHSAFEQ